MEFFNSLSKSVDEETLSDESATKCILTILKLLFPITPHICFTILKAFDPHEALNPSWPSKIDNVAGTEEVQIIIQINGKLRGRINVQAGLGKEEVLKIAEEDQKIKIILLTLVLQRSFLSLTN